MSTFKTKIKDILGFLKKLSFQVQILLLFYEKHYLNSFTLNCTDNRLSNYLYYKVNAG